MPTAEDIEPKYQAVETWLEENTRSYPPTERVRLSDFEWSNPEIYAGAFMATVSDDGAFERFEFFADGAGKIKIAPPFFTSPLGAPATYIAIDIPDATYKAIERGIRHVVPRLRPFGIDPVTGAHVDVRSPLTSRLQEPLNKIRSRLLSDIGNIEVLYRHTSGSGRAAALVQGGSSELRGWVHSLGQDALRPVPPEPIDRRSADFPDMAPSIAAAVRSAAAFTGLSARCAYC
jgi:hypothetical protein